MLIRGGSGSDTLPPWRIWKNYGSNRRNRDSSPPVENNLRNVNRIRWSSRSPWDASAPFALRRRWRSFLSSDFVSFCFRRYFLACVCPPTGLRFSSPPVAIACPPINVKFAWFRRDSWLGARTAAPFLLMISSDMAQRTSVLRPARYGCSHWREQESLPPLPNDSCQSKRVPARRCRRAVYVYCRKFNPLRWVALQLPTPPNDYAVSSDQRGKL